MFVSKDAMQASKVQVRSASVPRTRMKSPKQLRKISGETVAMSKSRKLQECIVPGTYRNVSISHARDPDFELERASKLMNGRWRWEFGMICFPWCSVLERFNCPSGLHKPVGSGRLMHVVSSVLQEDCGTRYEAENLRVQNEAEILEEQHLYILAVDI
jgi:hypothetical protein